MKNTEVVKHLKDMGYDTIKNYILPGMQSSLIGEGKNGGKVRMFVSTYYNHGFVTPHSHKFNLLSYVVRGSVVNTLYINKYFSPSFEFIKSKVEYKGAVGEYSTPFDDEKVVCSLIENTYEAGEWYYMEADEIHSIKFSNDAIVLIFEGPTLKNYNYILQPCVDDQMLMTFDRHDWMFKEE